MIIYLINEINKFLFSNARNIFCLNLDEHKIFLRRLSDKLSKNDNYLIRSYYQFICYKKLIGRVKLFILNIAGYFLFFPVLVVFLINCLRIKKRISDHNLAVCTAINEDIIPYSLSSRYSILMTNNSGFCLELSDLNFISRFLIKYPFSSFFVLKNVFKIAQYKYFIRKHNCKAVIVTSEYSFTSSLLTSYCEEQNVRHINIMHGEKFYHIIDSFFSFNECYVWEVHYTNLFVSLGAASDQFIIEKPPFYFEMEKLSGNAGFGFKYYLDGTESVTEIQKLSESLGSKFESLIFRAHPVFTNIQTLEKNHINFENPKLVKITDSLKNSEYVCAKYSTVLYQASIMKRKIVLDDLSDPELFQQLKRMDYIMFSKPHIRLSELLTKSNL